MESVLAQIATARVIEIQAATGCLLEVAEQIATFEAEPQNHLSANFDYQRHDFLRIVGELNAPDEFGEALRNLIRRWDASGRNLTVMLEGDSDLLVGLQTAYRGCWFPTHSARAYLQAFPPERDYYETPIQAARRNFATLTMIQDCELLCGPCQNCDRYFIRPNRHRRRYCSLKCSSRDTATKATEDRRKDDQERRYRWAKEAYSEWTSKRRNAKTRASFILRYIRYHEKIWFTNKETNPRERTQPRSATKKWLTSWFKQGQPLVRRIRSQTQSAAESPLWTRG
jgi:hypothetical protein